MKKYLSLYACFIIACVLLQLRVSYSDAGKHKQALKLTTWDALGYYLYLPAICIYNDAAKLKWFPEIDKKYNVSGGEVYQASKHKNGNYVFKYLGGVSLLQAPFFLAAHVIAKRQGYPPDGFSPPYQYGVAFAALFYCILALFVLRRILLLYFSDLTVCITLLLLTLATNFIQYAAVDSGMSHAYIFPLYVFVLYTTIKWHNSQKGIWALLTGLIIGLATICRPTEAVMLFIPLLWNTHTKEAAREKWRMANANKQHVMMVVLGGIIGILPQLIYWKMVTGSLIYDVGSKWDFANPHFRVLFGWEKGWFIYTPVTVFFIIGMFYMKGLPFKKSVLWFCLLNILIVIAWSDWQYGGSYSTRALVQSYPVFALPFAAFIQRVNNTRWRWLFYLAGAYLIVVNIFQIGQYNATILHFRDMNRKYYGRIYLNPSPTPADMSVMDSCEVPDNENNFEEKLIYSSDSINLSFAEQGSSQILMRVPFHYDATKKERWVRIDVDVKSDNFWGAWLVADMDDQVKRLRLFSPISKAGQINHYTFYLEVKNSSLDHMVGVSVDAPVGFNAVVEKVTSTALQR